MFVNKIISVHLLLHLCKISIQKKTFSLVDNFKICSCMMSSWAIVSYIPCLCESKVSSKSETSLVHVGLHIHVSFSKNGLVCCYSSWEVIYQSPCNEWITIVMHLPNACKWPQNFMFLCQQIIRNLGLDIDTCTLYMWIVYQGKNTQEL